MRSFLTINTPAPDTMLLTIQEMRVLAGLADTDASQDPKLTRVAQQVASAIAVECNIAVGDGADPTLRRETVTQSIFGVCNRQLVLARRHNVSVITVNVDGAFLEPAQFWCDPEAGLLTRMQSDTEIEWVARKVVINYQAGFAVVPYDLKMVALAFASVGLVSTGVTTGPLKLEEIDIDGIDRIRTEYYNPSSTISYTGSAEKTPVPTELQGALKRFRNLIVC
jgi:hypothetical protein